MRVTQTAARFLAILARTTRYVNRANAIVKKTGSMPQEELHRQMPLWGSEMLGLLNIKLDVKGAFRASEPTMIVGNHLSYLDIPLLMSLGPVRFIAKKQIARWPVFGRAFRCAGTIFVERDSAKSRKFVADQIGPRMLRENQNIAIFPSGTTSVDESKPWRWGAFHIAKEYGIPVQPFRLRYEPVRLAAFIDEDAFVTHLWRVLNSGEIRASIEIHEPIGITDPEAQAQEWQEWARKFLI